MQKLLSSKTSPIKFIILIGIVFLVGSVFSWWRVVYNSPTNVFNRMLSNSLATNSVTKLVNQDDGTQKLTQTSVLMTEPQQQVHAESVLGQVADAKTSITTESIGTPADDFVRYTDIKTGQKSPNGNAFNFSSVLGIWGKSDQNDPTGGGAQLYNQTLLGAVPMANIPQPLRKELLRQIKRENVYRIDAGSIKKQLLEGRPVYAYDITVQPVPYVTMLKLFARAVGLKQLEQVDPSQYADSQPLKFTLDIDVWSGQLTKVSYKDSARTETLSAYGARVPVTLPASSIAINELQSRLQKIQ